MKKLPFYAILRDRHTLDTCCGVDEVGGFEFNQYGEDEGVGLTYGHAGMLTASGTGLFVSAFINEPMSRKAYEELCREHVLLYQSPVKVNKGSGNKLFLCVFMHKSRKDKAKKESSVWPASSEAVVQRDGESLPQW